jgi:two-component system response regulator YesN
LFSSFGKQKANQLLSAKHMGERQSTRSRKGIPRKTSVFYRYLISYTGLVIVACTLLGVVSFTVYGRMLAVEINRVNEYKLSLIAADLESQFETMKDAALNVSVSTYYKPYYFKADKTHEIRLLEDFSKYRLISPIIDDYFLFYKGEERLFKDNAKNSLSVYFEKVLGVHDYQRAIDTIARAPRCTVIHLSAKDRPVMVFVYPVATQSGSDEGEAVLCFVTYKETFENRVRAVAGEMDGSLACDFRGETVMMLNGEANPNAIVDTGLVVESVKGLFRLSYTQESNNIGSELTSLWKTGIWFMIVVLISLLGVGAALAYSNYMPIKKLRHIERSLADPIEVQPGADELDRVGLLISNLVERDSKKKLILARQVVNHLIDNGYNQEIRQTMATVGMDLSGGLFCLFSVEAIRDEGRDRTRNAEAFYDMIEALSREGISYLPGVKRPNGCFTILATIAAPDDRETACKRIREVGTAIFTDVMIGMSRVYSDISYTSAAYLESQIALNIASADIGQPTYNFDHASSSDAIYSYDSDSMLRLVQALKTGQEKQAILYLEKIISQLQRYPRTLVIHRHICSGILTNIFSVLRDLELSVDCRYIISAITMHNLTDFRQSVIRIIQNSCQVISERQSAQTRQLAQNIIGYIDAHYTEYDMSLKHLEDHFHMPSVQISKLIKESTGYRFKSYLTHLRIEHSKRLLLDNKLSVHAVSAAVGYGSVSHFIRVFTEYTGHTPAKYRG